MTNREYLEDEDAEEPDDFVISLTSQVSYMFISNILQRKEKKNSRNTLL